MSDVNPFQAPAVTEVAGDFVPSRDYGGIGRMQYFGFSFAIGLVNNIIQMLLINAGVEAAVIIMVIIGFAVGMYLAVLRLKNLGYSGWWALGMIVPLLNIVVALRCLAAPEGYADHKTLDTPGKVIIGIFLAIFVLVIAAFVFAAVA
jgi:uncharacterized membrane protein YhaH (DUF805 family)